ncbi:MAG: hypothetical protein LC798_11050 [Chloroflexi bacterium]|nr:hypothetical protein [Chloroflexota bacterium]
MGDSAKALTAVKFAEGSENVIEGLGIPFGGPFAGKDIQGETFTPETDFCLDWFEKRPLLYDHGVNGKIGTTRIGDVIEHEMTDDGVWVKAQLDKRTKYYAIVKQLIEAQGVGFSSGAVSYLTQRSKSGEVNRWPWFEMSLTSTEANPKAAVYAVKASDALQHMEAAHIDIPEPLEAALKAVDEWAIEQTPGDSEPESLANHSERVLAGVKAWVERVTEKASFRVTQDRKPLSEVNLAAVKSVQAELAALVETATRPDTDEAEATKAALELQLALTET